MNNFVLVTFYVITYSCLSFVFCKHALMIFQQQHYELRRYSNWLFNKSNIHFSSTILYSAILIIIEILYINGIFNSTTSMLFSLVLTVCYTIYLLYKESNKVYIKDLVITKRVKRQIVVFAILLLLSIYLFMFLNIGLLLGIFAIFIPYLLIYPMFFITYPFEEAIKKHYEDDAKKILYSYDDLIKIGITGSYGKTSTKNIINDIISQNYLTLITPSSYNTPMGITRTIREMLKPIHEVFICEMGADKVNDISYLMDFVKPKYGIVTSIGPQHLATFDSIDNIVKEKMKEIEMLPSDGVGFINLDNEFIQNYSIKNKCKIVSVGIDNDKADYVAKNVKYSNNGSSFTVKIKNRNHKFTTSLLGKHNITNILIGIAVALELGIPLKQIVENVKNVKQVEHRLEVKEINNFTFIDDAFNSNPVGSKMAVDVLNLMRGKRVIITPGMIDLGTSENDLNYEFGKYMANKVDFVILVGEKQTKFIYNGLVDNKFNMDNVIVLANIRDAMNYVYLNFSSEDTILLENDLPDAFSK